MPWHVIVFFLKLIRATYNKSPIYASKKIVMIWALYTTDSLI